MTLDGRGLMVKLILGNLEEQKNGYFRKKA